MEALLRKVAPLYAEFGGVSVEDALYRLRACDEVVELPGGAAARRGHILHLVAPQRGLSGRRLLRACRSVVAELHRGHPFLACPIRKPNTKALKLALALNFRPYAETEGHIWVRHYAGEPL